MDVNVLFKRLIQAETINENANEIVGMKVLEDYLTHHNLPYKLYFSQRNRPNLVASLKSTVSGPYEEPPLVLLSHMDVVSVEEIEWKYPPFSAEEQEGAIWGRGTLDTKQLTAMHANAFVKASELSYRNRTIHFVVTSDEENGSKEGMAFLRRNKPEYFRDAIVLSEGGGFIVEDPLNTEQFMLYARAEKGSARIQLEARAEGGHAASPPDETVVSKLTDNLLRLTHTYETANEKVYIKRFKERLGSLMKCDDEQGKFSLNLFEYMTKPTFSIQSIDVGTDRLNVLPSSGTITIDMRTLPEMTESDVMEFISSCQLDEDIKVKMLSFEPGYYSKDEEELIALFEEESKKLGFHGEWLGFTALGRTDGRFLANIASNIYGLSPTLTPFTEVLKRVHQSNERIEVDSFHFGVDLMANVVEAFVSNGMEVS